MPAAIQTTRGCSGDATDCNTTRGLYVKYFEISSATRFGAIYFKFHLLLHHVDFLMCNSDYLD